MAMILLQQSAPIDDRARAARDQFSHTMGTETLILLGVALVGALVVFFLLGRLYLSWMERRHGYHEDYLKKRMEFD